ARTDIVFLVRKARDGTLDYEQINLDSILADPNDATNLTLQSEDLIRVSTKSAYLDRGTVTVSGAVRQGTTEFPFDFNDRMTISDAVMISGGLTAGANEYGYVVRKNPDNLEESTNVSFNIEDIMNAPNSAIDLELRPFDEIVILSNSTFTETYDINVTGAVRDPGSFPFATGMKLRDVILRSGGLEEFADASAYVMRPDPSNPERVSYKIVNPKAAMEDPNSTSNIEILPRDTIQVLAMQTFTDEFYIRVQGEVRNPGEFKYDESLKLSDVLRMSGGLKKEAAANKIEIFRLQINDNNPTQTVVAEFDLDRNLPIGGTNDTQLAPFDVVVVRRIPNFDPIQTVNITGEVKYPGVYALIGDNERIQSVIKRAGGTTYEAFVEGATLFREEDEIGYVVFDFERALSSKNSRDNIILKPGDVIEIPKQEDLVSLRGATNAPELLPDKYLQDGTIDVVYHKGKRAMFYIKKYAGGASENAKKSTITVEQPNGKLARTVDLGIFKIYPKVEKGALISVGSKPAREIEADQEPIQNEPVDWGEIVSNALAQVSAVLTVVLLIERTNN
ncbi:MAG: SLBB domain-containing protein, partial [Bacteroidota bacterium]